MAETTPPSLTPINMDVHPQEADVTTTEGAVEVQEVVSDEGVYITPEMATRVTFQQEGVSILSCDGSRDTSQVPQVEHITEIIIPSSEFESKPEGGGVFRADLPNNMPEAGETFPIDIPMAESIINCPVEQQQPTDGFAQQVETIFPSQSGSEMKDTIDGVEAEGPRNSSQAPPSQQIDPIDALGTPAETPESEPQTVEQTQDPSDIVLQDTEQPQDSAETTLDNADEEPDQQDESRSVPDLIFVCVHGQTFRCKPQTGTPIKSPPKEEPVNSCACSKSKKTAQSKPAADSQNSRSTRKLRNRRQNFYCDRCDETFTQKSSFEHHKASHDDEEDDEEAAMEEELSEVGEETSLTETTTQKSPSGRVQTRSRQKKDRQEKLCPDCGKLFRTDKALQTHKRQHERENCKEDGGENSPTKDGKQRNLSCTTCNKTFTRMYDVERHMETHIDGDRRKCRSCAKSFQTIKSRERHETLHCDTKRQNKCETCDVVFGSKFKLLRHEREHLTSEEIENLSCKTCSKVFTNANSLLRHEKLHLKEQGATITCLYCPETFDDRFTFNTHKKTHTVKAYQCDLCSMKFKHEYLLNIHMKRLTCQKKRESLRDAQCKLCQKIVKGTATLKRHMRTHTKEKPYPCRIGCGSAFSSTSNRLSHERMYCKMSPSYLCPHCGEVLTNQARLIYHESKYHGIGPVVAGQRTQTTEFPCRFCGKVFFFKGGRKRHERIHTDEKPYMCQFCPKAFVHASALVCHERVHTKARPYKCDECGKAFSQATHLKTHTRVHTKEKPYKCRLCDKSFSHMGTRKSHEGTHKNVDPGVQADDPMVQRVNEFQITQQDQQGIPAEIKVVHHEVPVQHKLHASHHEHEVQAADVILQLLESGSRVPNFEGFVHLAPS
ncbi:uncharacterized protein [Asterias amurensis]|uniref:uncharacterized protein isoform X2 n=1 Tax=Asterias amurensis TaxID=7602 RepID=UPI003AB87BF9